MSEFLTSSLAADVPSQAFAAIFYTGIHNYHRHKASNTCATMRLMDGLTTNQELYCQARCKGLSQRAAYRSAYPRSQKWQEASVDKQACQLEKLPKVSSRLRELQQQAGKSAKITRAKLLARLDKLANTAMEQVEDETKQGYDISAQKAGIVINATKELLPYVEDVTDESESFPLLDTASLIPGCYADMWRDIMAGGHDEYIGESGRGSAKSTVLLTEAPLMLMLKDPRMCGVAFRQVGNTLRDSIYATFISSIMRLGLADAFEWTVSPMLIRRKSTGQIILFRGLDDPEKAKSLALPNPDMYIGFACWEEFDQIKGGMRTIRKVQQTIKRAGVKQFWTFRAFNTPTNEAHWAHAYTAQQEENEQAYVVRFNYLDIPPEFLGDAFIKEAEALREIDEEAYKNEYLGIATGRKGKVFTNLERREITAQERDGLKWIHCGVDWGYAVDPWVFVRVGYDAKHKTIYILEEDKGLRLSNETSAARVIERFKLADQGQLLIKAARNTILADGAEPKSIASYRALGLNARAAKKWAGSVEAGIQWLQTRAAIVIDKSCSLAWAEFSAYDYGTGTDGEPQENDYPDANNHTIDAVRYACNPLIANKKEV